MKYKTDIGSLIRSTIDEIMECRARDVLLHYGISKPSKALVRRVAKSIERERIRRSREMDEGDEFAN